MRARSALGRLARLAVALFVSLLIRFVRPLVVIRFGVIHTSRIGDLAWRPEIYLCERDASLGQRRALDLFYPEMLVANRHLLSMFGRFVRVTSLAEDLAKVSRRLPGSATHSVSMPVRDLRGLLATTPPHLSFTSAERREGDAALRRLGVPGGTQYICFHARDSAYLAVTYGGMRDWSYHSYRDSDIRTYLPAAEAMVRRGHYAIRIGSVVEGELGGGTPAGIIDYSRSGHRSEFMDIYLGGTCRFFLGNDSGLLFVPVAFRRAVALANFIPLQWPPIGSGRDLFIPKRMWLRAERRFLTFQEMREPNLFSAQEYERRGLEPVDSTPEEILDLAVEMDERLNGTWETTEEDEDLQRRFGAIFPPSEVGRTLMGIGANFLRANRSLLGDVT